MEYPKPHNAEEILSNLVWKTASSTLIAYLGEQGGYQRYNFLLRTKAGKYFMQMDGPGESKIYPMSLDNALQHYQGSRVKVVSFEVAFPDGFPDA
jgi:hypothetical protein